MNLRPGLFGLFILAVIALPASATDIRFSTGLSPTQMVESGLDHLTAEQIAVIDALVRRTAPSSAESNGPSAALPFSQRLAATERAAAGLDRLGAGELGRLDALVAEETAVALAKPVPAYKPDTWAQRLKVHGAVTFGIGGGHGYSTRFAESEVEIYDPVTGMSLTVGYGTSRDKFSGPASWTYRRPMESNFQRP
jgi:hypothetical protein